MALLSSIVARLLGITDYALSYFATVGDAGQGTVGNAACGDAFNILYVNMTVCGKGFITEAMGMAYTLIALVPQFLGGLFAIRT